MTGRYNANVRVGGWFDELVVQEELLKQYSRKTEDNTLKILRTRRFFLDMLTEVTLTMPVKGLTYGGIIQIMG